MKLFSVLTCNTQVLYATYIVSVHLKAINNFDVNKHLIPYYRQEIVIMINCTISKTSLKKQNTHSSCDRWIMDIGS